MAPEHAAGQTAGAGARCALKAPQLYSLAQAFRHVPDPRARDGRPYPLWAILTVLALGLLLGRVHLSEIFRDGQRLSQFQRQRIGFRQRRGSRFVPTPCYNVYRTVLCRLDLNALAQVLTDWLSAHRGHLPATLAYDGKTIRDRLGLIVTLLDVEEGVPLAVAAEPRGKGHEMTCARQLLHSVPLENVTVIADSLHTNAENAHTIVSEKGGDYIAALKDNQPILHALAPQRLDGTHPPFVHCEPASGFVHERAARVVSIEPDAAAYPHAAQLVSLQRQRTHKRSGATQNGTRYFVTSRRPSESGPTRLAEQIRGYWGVENKVHWRRGLQGGEDQCRLRDAHSACALALLRTALLALARYRGYDCLKAAQEEYAHRPQRALSCIRFQRLTRKE